MTARRLALAALLAVALPCAATGPKQVPQGGSGSSGTVTSVQCGTGLSGGTITTTGVCAVLYGSSAATAAQGNDARFPASVTGLRKGAGAGSADVAAAAGTDYLAPNGSAAALTGFPTLNQNTTGNAATATALAANPADCSANQYATAIDVSGNLTCAQLSASQVTGISGTYLPVASPLWTGIGGGPSLGVTGAVSKANIGATGAQVSTAVSTLTDTASSGTVAVIAANAFGVPTLAASSATTCTACATVYIAGAPTAGSGVTQTAPYALYVNAGNAIFGGNTGFGIAPTVKLQVAGAMTVTGGGINLAVNNGANGISIGSGSTTGQVTIGGGSNLVSVGSHIAATGTAPTPSACGTGSPSVSGSDAKGVITTATAATSCTLTFASAFASAPVCVANSSTSASAVGVNSIGTSAVTFGLSAALTGTIYYLCLQ